MTEAADVLTEITGWATSYPAIAAGELATVTDVVPTLTGHPARTVAEHLRAHSEDWANLRQPRAAAMAFQRSRL